jgi:hypothetical protein
MLVRTLLILALGTSLGACVFLDDDSNSIRGYTECGSFLGGESCAPGQYCSDATFSECANGCLSDVNCASNQYCYKTSNQHVGICENTRTTAYGLGAADTGIDLPLETLAP